MHRFSVFVLLLLPAVSPAADLTGTVVDALDGTPLPGADVLVVGLDATTRTDGEGRYQLVVPGGAWRLSVSHPSYRPATLANQRAGADSRPGTLHLWPEIFPSAFEPTEATFGVGRGTGRGPDWWIPARLPRSPWHAPVPADLPSTIRVARYFASTCSGSIQQIDTVDFEDYVRGVVNAEVGVFRGVDGGPQAASESWKAFAVAARSYALHFILTTSHADYDINDTACNQVYRDDRDPDVSAAVDTTRGQILVKATDPDVIDRYFYAASCAHHGTEPGYNPGNILPDPTPVRACVGSWCGHDNCAGHADNPTLPGDDRCLVWGTCQWGSVERSMSGSTYVDILAHYQPLCTIRDLSGPATGVLKGVVYENPDLQDWIPGATVTLQDGPGVTFDGENPWEFRLEPGTYRVHAEATGYQPGFVERTVTAHETVWGSIGLDPVSPEDGGQDGGLDGFSDATLDSDDSDDSDDADDAGSAGPEDDIQPAGDGCGCGGGYHPGVSRGRSSPRSLPGILLALLTLSMMVRRSP